ncbi:MAG: valine--tRNA ligase [bacterium]|nr:valine--tRNA ligase [bacterium]
MVLVETEISKKYDSRQVEDKWYSFWEKNGFFHAKVTSGKKSFCIVIPPPNVTGVLHMGHALDETLQDILVRWKRMQGVNALWIPGTDHAGIATQNVIEKRLSQEGLTRDSLGREKFLKYAWKWKEEYRSRIISQLKRLGTSCDWSRERFTMDDDYARSVKEAFIRLYKNKLLYRDNYIVNWCPRCQTAISDIEVERKELKGSLYYLNYPLEQSNDQIVIATTRPETMLGDTAIAVHPQDKRYKRFIKKVVILPIIGRKIPVISDERVDSSFGTGAVKVTPAHDPVDYEIGLAHNLKQVVVIDEKGRMNKNAGVYNGMDRYSCREKLVEDLKKEGYLLKIESHLHNVGHCSRCHTVVEPLVSKQWFVSMKSLAQPAIKAVTSGKIKFSPPRWEKVYLNWMENIKDWCISRQIWWGHEIPVWYCSNCGEIIVDIEKPLKCGRCESMGLEKDSDVLDTWFSSALWPFATMGWPNQTKELGYFYPTTVLVTGYDIIYFWVARMIMMGLQFMDKIPFERVYLHGIVRDSSGKKMSKSAGNVIDPIDLVNQYGADTLRLALADLSTLGGQDILLTTTRIEGARNFCNKLWNAGRFSITNLAGYKNLNIDLTSHNLASDDWFILTKLNQTIVSLTESLERYKFNEAASKIYNFFWHEFCDWYLEIIKHRMSEGTGCAAARAVLFYVLKQSLKLLHPFIPFITEEIWQNLRKTVAPDLDKSIMISSWPEADSRYVNLEETNKAMLKYEVINVGRNLRGDWNIPLSENLNYIVKTTSIEEGKALSSDRIGMQRLLHATDVKIGYNIKVSSPFPSDLTKSGIEVFLCLGDKFDFASEKNRLEKKIAKLEEEFEKIGRKIDNQDFLGKAPKDVIKNQHKKREMISKNRIKLIENLDKVKSFL